MITYSPPEKLNPDGVAWYCRWQSNRQPFVFNWQRRDVSAVSFSDNGSGFIRCTLTTASGLNDDQVFQVRGLGTAVTIFRNGYVQTGLVTNIFAPINLDYFDLDLPYIAGFAATGEVNFVGYKTDYTVDLEVLYSNEDYNFNEPLVNLRGTFDTKGDLAMDIRTILEHRMDKVNRNAYTPTTNFQDRFKYLVFFVRYKYSYSEPDIDIDEPWVTDDFPFAAVDGATKLQERFGQNYALYETNPTGTIRAKFLTRFQKPTIFMGYPFSLSWIFGYLLRGNTTFINIRELNSSGTAISSTQAAFGSDFGPCIMQLNLLNTYQWNLGAREVETWIRNDSVPLASREVTERKIMTLNNDCRTAPIYLMWKNLLGGWDYWLFDKRYEVNFAAKQEGFVTVDPYDTELAQYREKITGSSMAKGYVLGDVVSQADAAVIAEIEASPQVYMLNDATRLTGSNPESAWLGVSVMPGGVKFNRDANPVEVELKIKLPDFYTTGN